ncbi:uncharacterized protein LOC129918101 [Episyrphus balteatus]|uniref:uncharacterized protein LOC129918101 n=1 Tax=Episyrphus balteatus TaxID=286459 RepID=UPI00248560CB|nr:uncharacterized protein LOC129918101 [Episyrphus balteatus]
MTFPTSGLVVFSALLAAEVLITEAEFNSKFLNFIEHINKVQKFESVFLLKSSQKPYFDDEFIRNITTSVDIPVILSTETSSFYLREFFNDNILTIVQFEGNDLLLQRLAEYLQHLRFCKTIFTLGSSSRNDLELGRVFNSCWKNRMINVLAVFQDFSTSSAFFSYNNIANFTIEEFIWKKKKNSNVFPNRMRNLQGTFLPVVFGGAEPATIISENSSGDTIVGGYLGDFFKSFAKKHNARLNTSSAKTSVSSFNIHKRILNGTVEISGGSMILLQDSFKWFSYPYIVCDWGVMLPIEQSIPIYKVFAFVFHWEAFVLTIIVLISLSSSLAIAAKFTGSSRNLVLRDLFFNIDPFRGMLGQSISEEPRAPLSLKILYTLIFLFGIMIVTSYDAFLQSFMTEPPRGKMIKSFDDLKKSGLKIYADQGDIDELLNKIRPDFMKKYSNLFQGETNFSIFTSFRDTLNTKNAFTVIQPKWNFYENQQNFFGQQLFRWSKELTLLKNILSPISINENSIYRKILNLYVLETQSSGLMEQWQKRSFYELVELGRIKKLDVEYKAKFKQMKVEDLKWIWIMIGLAFGVALMCLVGEICIVRLKNK